MNDKDFFLLIAFSMTGAVVSAVLYLMWVTLGKVQHALTWSFAGVALTVASCIALFAPSFPTEESVWLSFCAVTLGAMTLALRGHCQRTDCRILPNNLWPGSTVVLGAITWFTIASPHAGLSSGLLPLAAAVSLLLSAAMTIRQRRRPELAERVAAALLSLFGATQLAAAGIAMSQGVTADAALAGLNRQIQSVTLPVGVVSVAMFMVVLLANDRLRTLRKIAVRDQLTGLLNRRGFGEQATRAYATARRIGHTVSVIMADIDQFKSINDRFGHTVGDAALCHIASVFGEGRRSEDIVARMGGEEFAIVLPGTDIAESMRIATELCQSVEQNALSYAGGVVEMTASFGVATISDRDTCLTDVIIRADKALYRSKRGGRNRVDLDASHIVLIADRLKDRDLA